MYLRRLSRSNPNTSVRFGYDAHRLLADVVDLVRLHKHEHSDRRKVDVEEVDRKEDEESVGQVEDVADERKLLEEAPRDQLVACHQMTVDCVVSQ